MAPISIPRAPVIKGPTLVVYVLEHPAKKEDASWMTNRMEYCTMILNSYKVESASYHIAASKMVSLLVSCIPEIEKYLDANTTSVTFKQLSYSALVQRIAEGKAPGDEDSDDWGYSTLDLSCLTITNPLAVCASAAVAWMAYAKAAGESSRRGLEQARPKAMIGKYKLKDTESLLFPGETLGPEIENLDQVNLGFSLYPDLRKMITAFFLSLKGNSIFVSPNLDPFMMLFDLMENIGMTHVGIITRGVEMEPWLLKVPELASDLSEFASELSKMAMVDPEIRPYHRLLVPQTDYIFVGSKFRALIAVCGSFVVEVDGSYTDYVYNHQSYTDLITKVKNRKPANAEIPDVAALEAMFGVVATKPGADLKKRTLASHTAV